MVQKIENARERFGMAAMELFRTRGYEETTVPQIAAAAGLTERTFYRYFIDKAEVLFWRAAELETEILDAIRGVADERPLNRIATGLKTAGRFFEANRSDVIARQAAIAANPDFQEREFAKFASLAVAIGAVMTEQKISSSKARMLAEAGVVIWRVAIDRWCEEVPSTPFSGCVDACLQDLEAVTAERH